MALQQILLTGWLIFCAAGIAFAFGVLYERTKWNDLIREGKLPKPGLRWNRR